MREQWNALDPDGPPRLIWVRPVQARRVVLLLGAFDPPTRAHVALATGASKIAGMPAAFCFTKVLLDRPPDELLPAERRLELLDALGAEHGLGLAIANRGTYLEVARAARASGAEATFVIGSDKLPQLEDPRFYVDGAGGVAATFAEASFIVVRRGAVERPDVRVVEPGDVFADPRVARISGSDVRRRIAAGESVNDLVPDLVGVALAGYTRTSDSG